MGDALRTRATGDATGPQDRHGVHRRRAATAGPDALGHPQPGAARRSIHIYDTSAATPHDLVPHPPRPFNRSSDPQFDPRFRDVIGLYLHTARRVRDRWEVDFELRPAKRITPHVMVTVRWGGLRMDLSGCALLEIGLIDLSDPRPVSNEALEANGAAH